VLVQPAGEGRAYGQGITAGDVDAEIGPALPQLQAHGYGQTLGIHLSPSSLIAGDELLLQ